MTNFSLFWIKHSRLISYSLLGVFFLLCGYYIIEANTDLSSSRYMLWMDELITFDEIKSLLHQNSFSDWLRRMFTGENRYGRILFHWGYFVSYIPYKFWSDQGIVLAGRMMNAAILLMSYGILTWSFIKRPIMRVVLFVSLMLIQSTVYYATTQKPEPIQLLMLTLFAVFYAKAFYRFGWSWFWLGMALGSKISAIFLIPMVIVLSVISEYKGKHFVDSFKRVGWSLLSLGFGFLLAQGTLIMCFVERSLKPLELFLLVLQQESALSLTTIPSNVMHWWGALSDQFFLVPVWLWICLTLVNSTVMGVSIAQYRRVKEKDQEDICGLTRSLFLILMGVSLITPIVLLFKGGYVFYFHIGTVFLLLGLIGCCEYWFAHRSWKKTLAIASIGGLLGSAVWSFPVMINEFHKASTRTQTEEHAQKVYEYHKIKNFLDEFSKPFASQLTVYYDPYLYLPYSTNKYQVVRFWAGFRHWHHRAHIIIFYDNNIAKYSNDSEQWKIYDEYVCYAGRVANSRSCVYQEGDIGLDTIKVYIRKDVLNLYLKSQKGVQ